MGVCVSFHPLQGASVMVSEQGTDLWVYGMLSGIILLLYSFIRIIVLGFFPGPVSYLVSGSCEYVSLQCQVFLPFMDWVRNPILKSG